MSILFPLILTPYAVDACVGFGILWLYAELLGLIFEIKFGQNDKDISDKIFFGIC